MPLPAASHTPLGTHMHTRMSPGPRAALLLPVIPGPPGSVQSLHRPGHSSPVISQQWVRQWRVCLTGGTSSHCRAGYTAGSPPSSLHPTCGSDEMQTSRKIPGSRFSERGWSVGRRRRTAGSPAQASLSAPVSDTASDSHSDPVPQALSGAESTTGAVSEGPGSLRQAGLSRRQAVLGALCLGPASALFTAAPGHSLAAGSAVDLQSVGSTLVGDGPLVADLGSDLGLTLWRHEPGPSAQGNRAVSGLATISDTDWETVRAVVRRVLSPPKCPGALRLAFHDAGTFDQQTGTGGMNGSIIYELDRPESNGLKRSVKILTKAKEQLAAQGLDVSWADIIAVGGAEAVEMCGGPHIPLKLGRVDSGKADEPGRMPAETLNAEEVIKSFSSKGFSVQETVVLLGAHTLGGKGFGDATSFDNSYFSILLERPWNDTSNKMAYMIGLPSDKAIVEDSGAQKWIQTYASDEKLFFKDFVVAYVKLVNSGVVWQA